ncbi:MAG: SDR family oxidoreductase [Lachnospiraceae bacterium]|nr:SDR family oxidoreductase [Lachnospiraceae bacterium]
MDYQQLLKGKRVFVTTGARGIGKAIALLFASQGAVVAVGGKNRKALRETEKELQEIMPECLALECDLSFFDQTENVCKHLLKTWGGIDILVNSVGVNDRCTAHEYSDEQIERLMEINYKSGLRCVRCFAPGMLERGYGNIINISSIHSEMSMPGYMMYAGTKGAMNASARVMALDYARGGIRVNNICPGLIMSDAMKDEINEYPEGTAREEFMAMLDRMQPLLPGKMEDIANAALFLASDMSSFITGQSLMVDGGASIKAHP